MAITFRELRMIAELHYGKLPDAFKAKASEFFDALDQDGDGAVTLPELLNSNLEAKFGQEFIQHVFYNLDEEGKGHLEFRECLVLYYLCMYSTRVCAACGRNIPHGLGYTCLKCWKEGQPPNNEFCVCLECFSSHNYDHEHGPLHLLHDFVLFDNILHSRPSSLTSSPLAPVRAVEQTVKQCVVCGDYHESATRGFTCDVHMSRMRDSTEFVCEWCFSYLCSKCGNLFRDSTTRAEPGKWLQRFVCPSCHQKNITLDCYDASLKRLQKVLSGAELLRQCRTCEIKQRNGTLFWIVNGTNKVSASAPAANSQQRSPAPISRPRSNSFDNQPQVHPVYGGSGGGGGSLRGAGGDGSSPGNSFRGNDGSSRGGRGGTVNHMNMGQVPPPRPGAPPLINRQNVNNAAAMAMRTVNRMVNAAGRNLLNAGGGGGGGGMNMFNAGGGGGGGGGMDMFNAGGGGGGGGGMDMFNAGGGGGGDGSIGMTSDDGSGGDGGGDAGNGLDASSLLASLGSLVGGIGSDDSGAMFNVDVTISQEN